jgi:5-hydroxyisourate hydrolase
MTGVTTHVLDLATGRPVTGLEVRLAHRTDAGDWRQLASAVTDEDGRVREWRDAGDAELLPGQYRLTFVTGPHFVELDQDAFYPEVHVVFLVADTGEHHHVPLLLGPFGYTTYRGS